MDKENKETKRKLQFSKKIVILADILFILSLIACVYLCCVFGFDTTFAGIIITTTATICMTSRVWYQKKSQAENVIKERTEYTKTVANIEFEMYEKKLRLKKELGLLGEELDDIEDSIMDDAFEESVNSDEMYLEGRYDDATSDPEIHIV